MMIQIVKVMGHTYCLILIETDTPSVLESDSVNISMLQSDLLPCTRNTVSQLMETFMYIKYVIRSDGSLLVYKDVYRLQWFYGFCIEILLTSCGIEVNLFRVQLYMTWIYQPFLVILKDIILWVKLRVFY